MTPRCAAAAVVSAVVLRRPTKEYTHRYSMVHRRLTAAGIEVAPHYHQLLVDAFDENRRAVGMLNPMRDKHLRHVPGGRDDTCDHGLSRRSLEGKTSYELSWKVKVVITKKKKKNEGQTNGAVGKIDHLARLFLYVPFAVRRYAMYEYTSTSMNKMLVLCRLWSFTLAYYIFVRSGQ